MSLESCAEKAIRAGWPLDIAARNSLPWVSEYWNDLDTVGARPVGFNVIDQPDR
jgi:hypothetical protein